MDDLAKMIKQQRVVAGLTLGKLAALSGLTPSHLGRIERGERFPSASVLRKLAKPLGFGETELFTLAGFLSAIPSEESQKVPRCAIMRLDPYVAQILSQEPVEIQRVVIGILAILKSLAGSQSEEAEA